MSYKGKINLCFFSKKCVTCQNLLYLLKIEELNKYFKFICVDDPDVPIPNGIERVPTLIVINLKHPLVAKEAFEWIQKIKFIKKRKQMEVKKTINEGPLLYSEQEMNGMDDLFAFTKIDIALPHKYFKFGDDDKNTIITGPELPKLNKNDVVDKVDILEESRKKQDKISEERYALTKDNSSKLLNLQS